MENNDEILVSEIKETIIEKNDNSRLTTPWAIVIGSIIIALAIFFSNSSISLGGGSGSKSADSKAAKIDIKNVETKGDPFIGYENAPVTIAYWSDYQCPFCKRFETTSMQQIISNYVDSGKVKIVFKDYQFLGDDSHTASLYARAVWDLYPDKFFVWREAVFNKQDAENGGWGNENDLKTLTASIDAIDITKITSTINSNKTKYQKAIDDDKAEGEKFGISGTPGVILGTETIYGAQPYDTFKTAIDKLLK